MFTVNFLLKYFRTKLGSPAWNFQQLVQWKLVILQISGMLGTEDKIQNLENI